MCKIVPAPVFRFSIGFSHCLTKYDKFKYSGEECGI
jgi:hypothetical protein